MVDVDVDAAVDVDLVVAVMVGLLSLHRHSSSSYSPPLAVHLASSPCGHGIGTCPLTALAISSTVHRTTTACI